MEIRERDEYGRLAEGFAPSRKTEEVIEELRKLKATEEDIQAVADQLLERDGLIANLGMQLTMEKLNAMQTSAMVGSLGTEIPKLKLDIMILNSMVLKGGEE